LCATLARAIAVDSAGLVLDLSEVEFMAVSTLGVIVRAREFLRQRSRSLTVRAPSALAWRVIDTCGLRDLLGPNPARAGDEAGKALGTWVALPAAPRSDRWTAASTREPEPLPLRASRTIDLRASAASVEVPAER